MNLGAYHCCEVEIADEIALGAHGKIAVRDQLNNIIKHLCGEQPFRGHFKLQRGISFDSHPSAVGQAAWAAQKM